VQQTYTALLREYITQRWRSDTEYTGIHGISCRVGQVSFSLNHLKRLNWLFPKRIRKPVFLATKCFVAGLAAYRVTVGFEHVLMNLIRPTVFTQTVSRRLNTKVSMSYFVHEKAQGRVKSRGTQNH
jgi:hypothetical protein